MVVPVRNEEAFIAQCIESIAGNDYPKDRLEILVYDGISTDRTRSILAQLAERYPMIWVRDNPAKVVPAALNAGILEARGEVVLRMDAHAEYPRNYIGKCVEWLMRSGADVVGGALIARPGASNLVARAVAIAVSHPYGVANAWFRLKTRTPRWVDTVPFGAYRRRVFDTFGLFDEELVRNQDDEFNFRLIRGGGKIFLAPEIVAYYYARESLSKVFWQYFQYGYWKVRVLQKHRVPSTWRQLVPPSFVLALTVGGLLAAANPLGRYLFTLVLGTYLIATLLFSAHISLGQGPEYLPILPAAFAAIHFGYGLGFLKGIWDFLVLKKHRQGGIVDVRLTR